MQSIKILPDLIFSKTFITQNIHSTLYKTIYYLDIGTQNYYNIT